MQGRNNMFMLLCLFANEKTFTTTVIMFATFENNRPTFPNNYNTASMRI